MSELDDRIRDGLERLARPADGSETLDDVARRRRRYRVVRRARAATLAVAVVIGSAAGVWGLSRAFLEPNSRPAVPAARTGLIAFSTQTENGWDIFVVNPDGTGLRPLVAGPDDEIYPTWSPDGRRLAFITQREDTGNLHIIEADGSDRDEIYGAPVPLFPPAWSPDGSRIAMADANGRLVVWEQLEDGRSQYAAQSLGIPILGSLAWSPDGNHLAFVGGQERPQSYEEQPQIYVWNLERAALSRVTDMAGGPMAPAWSPDGSRIAFTNGWYGPGCASMAVDLGPQDAFFGVHIVDVEREITTRLSDNACHHSPAWSPDGTRIAFVSEERSAHWVEVVWVERPEEAYVMHTSDADHPAFAWSPDGEMIALSTRDSLAMAAVEGQRTVIVTGIGMVGDISWQPARVPIVGPTPEPSPSGTVDPTTGCRTDGKPFLESYRPIGPEAEASVLTDGRSARIRIIAAEEFPPECRYFLAVELPDGEAFYAAVSPVEGVPSVPEVLMAAEVDGEPGAEVVVDIGGPGHPHRTGVVFTFDGTNLVAMSIRGADPGGTHPSYSVPLGGEFAAGVDCAGEPGAIVATSGSFADEGNDDRHYDITREFYRADGAVFEAFDRETFKVEVGEERERWPETADDPFRSCPR